MRRFVAVLLLLVMAAVAPVAGAVELDGSDPDAGAGCPCEYPGESSPTGPGENTYSPW